jgi:hypothetical protein
MLEVLRNITLKALELGENPDEVELLLNGITTKKFVWGHFLEAAFKWEGFYIILTTTSTWEDSELKISFFDIHFNLIDSAYLEPHPVPKNKFATVELIEIIQPDCIRVDYSSRWKIKLLKKKKFRLPFIAEPSDVARLNNVFSCHFIVSHY